MSKVLYVLHTIQQYSRQYIRIGTESQYSVFCMLETSREDIRHSILRASGVDSTACALRQDAQYGV